MKEEKKTMREELKELSPLLSKMKEREENPFQTPEHYFRRLTQQVLERTALEPRPERPRRTNTWTTWLSGLLTPRLAAGLAAVALLIAAGLFFLRPEPAEPAGLTAELTTEEMSEYISTNIDEFELEMLVAVAEADAPASGLENNEELDQYLDEIIDEMELEDLEELF